ncbi:MAG: transglutaminase-like domain-containing protein [Faecalibacterium sp.]
MMYDQNEAFCSLNVGLPDDVARYKAAGYYQQAIRRIDDLLAEDWTATQNQPVGAEPSVRPKNPTPRGVEAQRRALLVQREILLRLPEEYCWPEAQAVARMQGLVRDFTAEEFRALDWKGRIDWRYVEGEKRYQKRFAETLLATHPELAARQLDPPAPNAEARARRVRIHEQMVRSGSASARITLRTSAGMSDAVFAAALARAKAEGRSSVHVKVWLPLPAACPAQSEIELLSFTEPPTYIAAEDAPQRTAFWEADLTENRSFGAQYRYRATAMYADPLDVVPDAVQPDFDTQEQAPHIVFTPYLRELAAQLTAGLSDPVQKAKRIYDYVTLNVRYHYQPAYFVQECLPDRCARDRRGDCGIMALTFITLCRLAGIPARWQSGLAVSPAGVGCHDWAMFYIAPRGWMYADCSYGASMARAGDEVLRRHYFGSLDTGRMVANRAFQAPFDPPMTSFRDDPYDNQTGEVEADGVGLYGEQTVCTKEVEAFEELL